MARQSWDTSGKHLYRLHCETAIPPAIRNEIPRTNRHRWRTESPDKYVGSELNHIPANQLKLLQQFAANRKAQATFRTYLRIAILFRSIFLTIPKPKIPELAHHLPRRIRPPRRHPRPLQPHLVQILQAPRPFPVATAKTNKQT